MHQEGGQRATTILTRRPGHCGRPAPELRSVAQLPKVFIDGLDEHGIAEAKPPYKTFGALMEQAMRWTRSGWDSSGLCRFEAEILQSGAAGLQPPQIDGEQPGASHHGFLSGGSAGGGVATKNMRKFPKAPPGRVPFLETPDRFHQQRAHAAVAQPIDTAKLLSGAGAEFAGTTANVAADLFAIGEAFPVHRLPLQRSKSGWPQPLGYLASVVVALPGNLTVQLSDSSLLGDEQTLMVLEQFD